MTAIGGSDKWQRQVAAIPGGAEVPISVPQGVLADVALAVPRRSIRRSDRCSTPGTDPPAASLDRYPVAVAVGQSSAALTSSSIPVTSTG